MISRTRRMLLARLACSCYGHRLGVWHWNDARTELWRTCTRCYGVNEYRSELAQ